MTDADQLKLAMMQDCLKKEWLLNAEQIAYEIGEATICTSRMKGPNFVVEVRSKPLQESQ